MPPPLSAHPPRVQTLIKKLKTPTQVQRWLESLDYNKNETMYGLDMVVQRGRAHCLEGVLSAAAILEYHNYPPLILDLQSKDLLDHTLFLYQEHGKYGAVGKSRDIGLDGRKPVFKTIRDLVNSYAIPYIDEHAELFGYGALDLRTLSGRWRSSKQSIWYVEDALRHIPHKKFSLSAKTTKLWRKKYLRFKKQHPNQQPDYFPRQGAWL